jgi:quinoprotein glucose dehydrogenase
MIRTTLASLALTASLPAATQVFQTFEGDGFGDWKVDGSAFGLAPAAGKTDDMEKPFTAYADDSLASSTHGGDGATGSLTSPEFTIKEPYIRFLIAGGSEAGKTAAQLLVDGKVVREATGKRSLRCESAVWDVRDLKGRQATIRLLDEATGEWGFIGVDHLFFTDYPNQKFPPTTREGKPFIDGLARTDVIAGANIPIGSTLKIEATSKDHQLTSPTAITFDEQGRVFVAETRRFRAGVEDDRDRLYWYLDDLAAKKTSDRRALHEKWKDKLPLEKMTEKSETIRRLADTDGDGKIDESKVVADGFNDVLDGTAAGIFHYDGCLYFACIPKIYMLRDTTGDGVTDERKVVVDGFGVRVSLSGHDLNGFTLGPDGRIYGTMGDRGMSLITKEGTAIDYPNEGAVFRFEPDGSGFELFHTGLRNPKEIAFDALGNPFTVDNNSDQGDAARVVYLAEGGDSGWQMEHQAMHTFHRQIGLKERPPSRWMDEKMWELENPAQPAFILPPSAHLTSGPSGLTVHPGVGFLESEANHFLISDYRGGSANSGIWSFEMKPKGAGMEMTDSRQLVWGIGATDVEYSWDGKIYISDFVTGWKAHQGGQLLSLDAGKNTWNAADAASSARIMKAGFEDRSSAELANLFKHPDARIRLRAQIALTRKLDALKRFSDASESTNSMARIHGIWGLGIIARRGSSPLPFAEFGDIPTTKTRTEAETKLISLLSDKSAEIRLQALRALGDVKDGSPSIPVGPLLVDESPRVRYFAAMLIGKRELISHYGPICDLLAENDNRDVYLRHAGIFALQNLAKNPAILVGLTQHESPAVRLAAVVALRRMKNPAVGNFLHDPDPKVADEAIRAISDNDMVAQRPRVAALLDLLESRTWTPFMLRRLIHNAFRIGTAENVDRVIKVAADPQIPASVRQEALRLLHEWVEPFPADQLTGHWRPLEKRDPEIVRPALTAALPHLLKQEGFVLTAALELVGHYQLKIAGLDDAALRRLVQGEKLPGEARASALTLLVGRKPADLVNFLSQVSGDPSDEVAMVALAELAKLSPEAALPALEKTVDSRSTSRIQKSWPILAALPGDAVDSIFSRKLDELRAASGISPSALELLAAAKTRSSASVTAALAAYEKSLAEDSDPLAKWNSVLEGGDSKSGAALFDSHPASECSRCHRAEEGHAAGGETAPNLVGIANRHKDRRYFLESMVNPGAVIAPGFGAVLIDLKNGATLTGNLIAETPEHLDIDAEGKSLRVRRSDIASVTPPASPMPPMGDLLKPDELRDLVAWLATLNKGGEKPRPASEPILFDPASVKTSEIPAATGVDPAILKIGRQQFIVCGACHGQNGEGTAAGPPLAGSEWVNGPQENLIRIQLRGLQGPITVNGKEFNMPGGMAALAYQTDDQIAAVLTYIRSSFGNSAPPVTSAAVAALRGEVGKPPVTAAELAPPVPATTEAKANESAAKLAEPTTPVSGKYDDLKKDSRSYLWISLVAGLVAIGALVQTLRRKEK